MEENSCRNEVKRGKRKLLKESEGNKGKKKEKKQEKRKKKYTISKIRRKKENVSQK